VCLAVEWTCGKTIIESDCSTIIAATSYFSKKIVATSKLCVDKSHMMFIINDLKLIAKSLPEMRFQAMRRE